MNDKKMHCWLHQYFFTWSFCIPYFVIHAFSLIYQIHPSACFVGVCQYVGWIINFLCIKLHRKSSLKFYRREREWVYEKSCSDIFRSKIDLQVAPDKSLHQLMKNREISGSFLLQSKIWQKQKLDRLLFFVENNPKILKMFISSV